MIFVGGRSFTRIILQKNCHEFIAYENLIPVPRTSGRPAEKARVVAAADSNLSKALPMVRRALKVLSDREVSPQLGLLKSTLLQLDSTFSERDYNASTFRDFIEMMAAAGYVTLKQVDRSLLVEMKETETISGLPEEAETVAQPPLDVPVQDAQPAAQAASTPPVGPPQPEEMIRTLQDVLRNARVTPHWPMYLRNLKQYIKNASPTFDERRFGFVNFLEAVRAAQRGGLFRLERNRQGILRIFPGNQFPQPERAVSIPLEEREQQSEQPVVLEVASSIEEETIPVVEAEPIIEVTAEPISEEFPTTDAPEESAEKPTRKRRPPPAAPNRKKTASAARTRTPVRRPRKKATEAGEDSE